MAEGKLYLLIELCILNSDSWLTFNGWFDKNGREYRSKLECKRLSFEYLEYHLPEFHSKVSETD